MRRGEIRWAQHPDWPGGPALVLTRDEAIDRLNEVFVVLATTNTRGLPTEVELGDLIATLGSERAAEVCRALDRATAC